MVVQSVYERPTIVGDSIIAGVPFLPHGLERHVIPGGGSRGIKIDKVTISELLIKKVFKLLRCVFLHLMEYQMRVFLELKD